MLPFISEPIEQLKARFPKALEKVWVITIPMPDRPGLHRENVFDFPNGIRLLISRDNLIDKTEIHVSASWEYNEPKSIEQMNINVLACFRAIGGTGTLRFLGWSPNAIPHWIIKGGNYSNLE
jgi:hypothetical protein